MRAGEAGQRAERLVPIATHQIVEVDHTLAKLVETVITVLPEKFGAVYSDRPANRLC